MKFMKILMFLQLIFDYILKFGSKFIFIYLSIKLILNLITGIECSDSFINFILIVALYASFYSHKLENKNTKNENCYCELDIKFKD